MPQSSLLSSVLQAISSSIAILSKVNTKQRMNTLLAKLGYDAPEFVPPDLSAFADSVVIFSIFQQHVTNEDWVLASESLLTDVIPTLEDLQISINELHNKIQQLTVSVPSFYNDSNIKNTLAKRLFDFLLISYIEKNNPSVAKTLRLTGILEVQNQQADAAAFKSTCSLKIIHWDKIIGFLADPIDQLQQTYNWSANNNDVQEFIQSKYELLLESLVEQLNTLHLSAGVYPHKQNGSLKEVRVPLIMQGDWPSTYAELGVTLRILIDQNSNLPIGGFELEGYTYGGLSLVGSLPPIDFSSWRIIFNFDLSASANGELLLRTSPNQGFTLETSSGSSADLKASFTLNQQQAISPMYLIGSPGTSSLSFKDIALTGFLNATTTSNDLDIGISFNILGGNLSIRKENSDGFITKIIPGEGAGVDFDLLAGWSPSSGLYFQGNTALSILFPSHFSFGPIDFSVIQLDIKPQNNSLPITAAANIEADLGPISIVIENIGVKTTFDFLPDNSGNLGPIDLSFAFKPPNGIGIAIDTDPVKGGGYLYINQAEGRYAGVAGLNIKDKIQLSAFGLIATKLPSGNSGYSFLLFVSAEFSPIQLGMGFTLNGVGGLVGIHRTVNIDQLSAGVKTGTYDRLLFPANPVDDALEIIADLRAIFPIQEGRFVFGLMGKIGWGSPTLITIDLGLIIELPQPVRLAILGVVKAVLPDQDGKILRLNVNFLGVIDFGKKRLSFDASIYDSRLLKFTLSGDMALRVAWGNNKNFILTVGGFHPSFNAPSGLSGLRRLQLSLLSGNNPRLTLSTYFAVTSNTAQFGAKVDVFVKVTKNISAEGYLGFDALFQFNPFYMNILAAAYMAVKWKGKEKFSVTVNVSLEGPTPWVVDGVAKVKILGISAKVKVKKTWGQSQNTSLPSVSVHPLLETALKDLRNWETIWPSGNQQLVQLLETPSTEHVLHPMGNLRISQKVLPLNLNIQQFGNQEVSDGGKHEITEISIGGNPMNIDNNTKEEFAPAHFRKMSETKKLSSPSFVKYNGGVLAKSSADLVGSAPMTRTIIYETFVYDAVTGVATPDNPFQEEPEVLTAMVHGGAAGQSALAFSPTIAPLGPNEITVLEEEYGVVFIHNMQLHSSAALQGSFTEAIDHYGELVTDDYTLKNQLKVVPKFEIL